MENQQFIVTVKVTLGTIGNVQELDVKDAVQDALDTFNGGTAEVIDVIED